MKHDAYCVIFSQSLVKNIGFSGDGRHCRMNRRYQRIMDSQDRMTPLAMGAVPKFAPLSAKTACILHESLEIYHRGRVKKIILSLSLSVLRFLVRILKAY